MKGRLLTVGLLAVFLMGCFSGDGDSFRTSSVLKMADSTAQYDVWLTVRVSHDDAEGQLPVSIKVESPDGNYSARDTFQMPLDREFIETCGSDRIRYCRSAFSCDVECLYREKVSPVICGEWRVTLESDGKRTQGMWIKAYGKKR